MKTCWLYFPARVKELMVLLGIFKYLYSTRMPSEVLISQLISAGESER